MLIQIQLYSVALILKIRKINVNFGYFGLDIPTIKQTQIKMTIFLNKIRRVRKSSDDSNLIKPRR